MKKSNLKTTGRWFTMLSVLAVLTACAADELVSQGQNQTPGDVETVASGTINFANQTAMTIGTSSAFGQTKAMTQEEMENFYGNDACDLTMPDEETVSVPENATKYESTTIEGIFVPISSDAVITENAKYYLSDGVISDDVTLYVQGDLSLIGTIGGGGRIVVLEGGTLTLQSLTDSSIGNIEIVNYGTISISNQLKELTIAGTASIFNYGTMSYESSPIKFHIYGALKEYNDLDINESINVYGSGKLYVGGSLSCSSLNPVTNGGCVHVIGSLNVPTLSFTQPFDLCVEGTLNCENLTVSCMANMHIGCKLEVNDKLTLYSGAVMQANYIKASEAEMGGNSSAQVNVWLPNQGVAELGELTLYENVLFKLYGSEKGLVTCTSLTATDGDLRGVFGNSFYVNYETSTPENLVFTDENLVNAAELLTSSTDNCKPDFTAPDPEPEPKPEPEPVTGEIILPIGDLALEQDFTLLADDFAIRVNGDYLDIVVDGNTATLDNIKILHGDDMVIKVTGLNETNILEGNDYTYECYIWIDNTSPLNDGTGGYGPLFDDELKQEWANPEWDPYDDPNKDNYDYYGVDVTSRIKGVKSPAGYAVRYNVYRGISGRLETDGNGIPVEGALGDTPYIKVSIHVQRDDDAPANSAVGIYPKIQE